jgi:Dolichyl-phosphate-mannose-protein mannosyltransferase
MRLADGARAVWARTRSLTPPAWLGPFGREPWIVLGPLLLVQWLALLVFMVTVRHNSWLYYQGGDQTYYWTTGWMFSHWRLPTAEVGWGWSYVLTPLAGILGNTVLEGLPAIILLDTLVLLPVALLGIYGIGARIGGRLFGYWTAALWIALPYIAIPLFVQRYHGKYVEQTLPQTFGLTPLADFPSMVLLIVAAYLVVRALDTRDWREAVLAGLVVGFAFSVKPSNVIFFPAPFLAFLIARRWRQLLYFGATLLPGILLVALWKQRGLGTQPLFAAGGDGTMAALGIPLPSAVLAGGIDRYVNIDWDHLRENRDSLREFFWAIRPLQWVALAGVVSLLRRSWAKGALIAVWFYAFLVVKGTSDHARVEDASFFRLLMPGYPALLLLIAAVPLLVPKLGTKLAQGYPPGRADPRRLTRPIIVAAVVLVALPAVVLAGTRVQTSATTVRNDAQHTLVPVSGSFGLDGTRRGGDVRLSWKRPYDGPIGAFYVVLRAPRKFPDPTNPEQRRVKEGVVCRQQRSGAAQDCHLYMRRIRATRADTYVDHPPNGRWTYRIGLAANWLDDPTRGDVLLVSDPVTVEVG